MTREAMIDNVQARLGNDAEATDALVAVYLDDAEAMVREKRRYPSDDFPTEAKYHNLMCRMATEMFLKRGAEGETNHSENGVSRTYSSAYHLVDNEVMQLVCTGNMQPPEPPEPDPDPDEPTTESEETGGADDETVEPELP